MRKEWRRQLATLSCKRVCIKVHSIFFLLIISHIEFFILFFSSAVHFRDTRMLGHTSLPFVHGCVVFHIAKIL